MMLSREHHDVLKRYRQNGAQARRLAEVQMLPRDTLQKLAVARVAAIADELKKQGVDAGRITQSKA